MLVAMSVLIGVFCKNFMNFGGGLFRVTFENIPIILSGIIFGPIVGGVVGIATDLVSYLFSAQIYPPNLIVTLGAFLIGFLSGLISRYVYKKSGYFQIILCASVSHIVGSMIVKTIGLFAFYGWLVLWRIPIYILIALIETALLCALYKNKVFRKTVFDDDFRRKN